jgi:hypothetical protein
MPYRKGEQTVRMNERDYPHHAGAGLLVACENFNSRY